MEGSEEVGRWVGSKRVGLERLGVCVGWVYGGGAAAALRGSKRAMSISSGSESETSSMRAFRDMMAVV